MASAEAAFQPLEIKFARAGLSRMADMEMELGKVPPLVTVIMPVRNESRAIRRSLGAVLSQDYPSARLEIIIVDGNSIDGTKEIAQSLKPEHQDLRILDNPRQIVSTALNLAIGEARGEIIVRVDGHCEIERDYIRRCVDHLTRGEADAVGGSMRTVGETSTAKVIAAAASSSFGVGNSTFRVMRNETRLVDTVPFPAYPRTILERLGPFDEELVRNQDDEYNYRLRKIGGRVLLAADVRSTYFARSSFRSLWRQYFQYGYWKVRVMQKHPAQMRLRQFVPPMFVSVLLVSALLSPFSAFARGLFMLVSSAYLVANLAVSAHKAAIGRSRLLPLLPMAYGVIHISYGLGFLWGLLRFANRWRGE